MPTYAKTARFSRDHDDLNDGQKAKFKDAVTKFIEDLRRDGKPRASLRVRGIQSAEGIFEFTWDGDGRATFEYGEQIRENEVHIIWRRIGTHDVFNDP